MDHRRLTADVSEFLGIVAYAMQSYREAQKYLQASLAYRDSIGNEGMAYDVLKLLTRVYLHTDIGKAKEFLRRAISISQTEMVNGQDIDFVLVWAKFYLFIGQAQRSAALLSFAAEQPKPSLRIYINQLREDLEGHLTLTELQEVLATKIDWNWTHERERLLSILVEETQ